MKPLIANVAANSLTCHVREADANLLILLPQLLPRLSLNLRNSGPMANLFLISHLKPPGKERQMRGLQPRTPVPPLRQEAGKPVGPGARSRQNPFRIAHDPPKTKLVLSQNRNPYRTQLHTIVDYCTVSGYDKQVMADTVRTQVLMSREEAERFESYCRERGFKKSTLIARLIREHLSVERFKPQQELFKTFGEGRLPR
jgi:hypothetical protein